MLKSESTKRLVLFLALALALPAAAQERSTIELLEAGAEPRKPLRYRFVEGMSERMVMTVDMRMTIRMGELRMPEQTIPSIKLTMNVTSEEVDAEGSARLAFDIIAIEGGGGALPGMDLLKATQGWVRLTDRGEPLDGSFEAPAGVPPQAAQLFENMEQSIQRMAAPLPEEPVGAGARWKVAMPIHAGAFDMIQTAHYSLESMTPGGFRTAVTLEQTAEAQEISAPGMPEGAKMKLEKLETTGGGTMELDLARLVPRSDATVDTEMTATLTMGGQQQPMHSSIHMKMTISAGE